MKNEERFTGKAEVYNKFRSSYPRELIDYLYTKVGFKSSSVIADIGSGTGILSRLLLERNSKVFAIEPNDDMRKIAEKSLDFKNYYSIKASAENTGIKEKSIDFITAAQAFHWFNISGFKVEAQRILKENGKIVLIWNTRDYEAEVIRKDYEIRKKTAIDTKGLRQTDIPSNLFNYYKEETCVYKTFQNDLILSKEAYIGMNLSRSYSPSEEKHQKNFHALVEGLSEIFDGFSDGGLMVFPQFTRLYVLDA